MSKTEQNIKIPTTIIEIDAVLGFLATNSHAQPNILFDDLFKYVNLLLKEDGLEQIDQAKFNRILHKLVKDDFVYANSVDDTHEFKITYEGNLTHLLGGYRNKYLVSHQLALSKSHQDRMARRLYWINFWIAVATGIAALYYLTKLYWEHGWFHFF